MVVTEVVSEGLKRKFRVEIPLKDVLEQAEKIVREKGKSYKAQGFRVGKVPFEKLKEVFGPQAWEKASERLIQRTATEVLKNKGLKAAQKPVYTLEALPNESEGKPLSYSLELELYPTLPEIDFGKLNLTLKKVEWTEADLDAQLKEWMQAQKEAVPISEDRETKEGDSVLVDMVLLEHGKEASKPESMELFLTKGDLGDELLEALLGHKPGDCVRRKIRLSDKVKDSKVRGKRINVQITLREIREMKPFEDLEKVALYLDFENLEKFREHGRNFLTRQAERLEFMWKKRQILDYLDQKVLFDVPTRMVEEEFERLWQEALRETGLSQAPQNVDEDAKKVRAKAIQEAFDMNEEEAKALYQRIAERRVRLGFLLSELAKAYEVHVTEDETKHLLRAELLRHPPQYADRIIEHYRTPQALAALQSPLFEEKTVRAILEKYSPTEKAEKITATALEDLLEQADSFLPNRKSPTSDTPPSENN